MEKHFCYIDYMWGCSQGSVYILLRPGFKRFSPRSEQQELRTLQRGECVSA